VVWISVRSLKVRMQFILNRLLQEQAKLAELQDKDPAAFPALPVGYFCIILGYLQSAFSLKIPLVLIPINAIAINRATIRDKDIRPRLSRLAYMGYAWSKFEKKNCRLLAV